MTYKEWESELVGYLKGMPAGELEKIKEYYREMYGDRSEAGMSDKQILAEFDDPKICAAKILMENGEDDVPEEEPRQEKSDKITVTLPKINLKKKLKGLSVSKIVGWFFLFILVVIPLAAIAVSVVAVFAATSIGCAAGVLGSIIIAVCAPFVSGITMGGANAAATAGIGLATAGVCALLSIAFFFITKYSVFVCVKISKYVFGGKNDEKAT
ncbi:MAG: DUF1700 domain-containing protein [Clostridia bacterium]|nr:DUF1700 domain-containing protein [Clostridia bacterium]